MIGLIAQGLGEYGAVASRGGGGGGGGDSLGDRFSDLMYQLRHADRSTWLIVGGVFVVLLVFFSRRR
jgi:hypothetical protein